MGQTSTLGSGLRAPNRGAGGAPSVADRSCLLCRGAQHKSERLPQRLEHLQRRQLPPAKRNRDCKIPHLQSYEWQIY